MRWYHRLLLGLSVTFFVLWIVNIILRSMDYLFVIQVHIPISLGTFLFGLMGLFSFLFLFFFSMGWMIKVLLSIMALMGIFLLALTSLGNGDYRYDVNENGDYTLIIEENRFLFSGKRAIYQKINGLLAKKIITCEVGDDYSCLYDIIDDQLRIQLYYEGEIIKTEWIDLYTKD